MAAGMYMYTLYAEMISVIRRNIADNIKVDFIKGMFLYL
jgi:hypothetical protein